MIKLTPDFTPARDRSLGWIKVPFWFSGTPMTPRERLLMGLILQTEHDGLDWRRLSDTYVQEWLGWTPETIRRTFRRLEKRRLIETELRMLVWMSSQVRFVRVNHERYERHSARARLGESRWWKYEGWLSRSQLPFATTMTLAVVIALADHDEPVSVARMTRMVGLGQSAVSQALRSLIALNIVEVIVKRLGPSKGSTRSFVIKQEGLLDLKKKSVQALPHAEDQPHKTNRSNQRSTSVGPTNPTKPTGTNRDQPHKTNRYKPGPTPQNQQVNINLLNTSLMNTLADAETSSSDGVLSDFSFNMKKTTTVVKSIEDREAEDEYDVNDYIGMSDLFEGLDNVFDDDGVEDDGVDDDEDEDDDPYQMTPFEEEGDDEDDNQDDDAVGVEDELVGGEGEVIAKPSPANDDHEWINTPTMYVPAEVLVEKEKMIDVDFELGQQLYNIVRKSGHRPANMKPLTQARGFAELRRIDQIPVEMIRSVVDWYAAHMNDEFVPQVYGSQQFREKWNNLKSAMVTWNAQNPSVPELTEGHQRALKFHLETCRQWEWHADMLECLDAFGCTIYSQMIQWKLRVQAYIDAHPDRWVSAARTGLDGIVRRTYSPAIQHYLDFYGGPGFLEYMDYVRQDTAHKRRPESHDWLWSPDSDYEFAYLARLGLRPADGRKQWNAVVSEVLNANQGA